MRSRFTLLAIHFYCFSAVILGLKLDPVWADAKSGAPYSFRSIPSDLSEPSDPFFFANTSSRTWSDDPFTEARKKFAELETRGQKLQSREDLEWNAKVKQLLADFDSQNPIADYVAWGNMAKKLVNIMDSPRTSPRLRSLVEHYYLDRIKHQVATSDEMGNDFGENSFKRYYLRSLLLKSLLYGAGKSEQEKIRVLDDVIRKIDAFYETGIKSPRYRYLRLANQSDLARLFRLVRGDSFDLAEEMRNRSTDLGVPAGFLGAANDQYYELFREISGSQLKTWKNPYGMKLSLFDLDSKVAASAWTEAQEKYRAEVIKRYDFEVETIEKNFPSDDRGPGRQHLRQAAFEVAEDGFKQALKRAPEATRPRLESLTIDDLIEPNANVRRHFMKLSTEAKLKLYEKVEPTFRDQWKRIRGATDTIVKSKDFSLSDPAEQRFFTLLFSTYFEDLDFESSKNIMKSMIERPELNQDERGVFRTIMLHAGPEFHALLQLLARKDGFSPEIRKIFSVLEDAGLESPSSYALEKLKTAPRGAKWLEIDSVPFVGSMAQTHRGKIEMNGKVIEIGARILKRNIGTKLRDEEPRLKRIAQLVDNDPFLRQHNFPLIQPILWDVHAMKQDETMMDLTRKNQIRAQAFRGTVQGRRIARIEFITPETLESNDKDVLYSTWLPGMKFEEYAKEYPSEAKELARIIATRWMNLAIFQGLLFHPDLHFGNFKVNVVSKDFVQVGLLDFGMLGELSPQTRDILAKLTLAKYWRNEKLIADYLWALSDERENMISKADLLAAITRHPEKFKLSEQEWVEWGLSQGLTVHREVTAFSRGLVTIGQLLETAGAKEDLEKIKVIVARQNLRETTRLIIQSTHDRFKGVPRSVEPDRPTPQVVKRMPAQAAGTLSCQALF